MSVARRVAAAGAVALLGLATLASIGTSEARAGVQAASPLELAAQDAWTPLGGDAHLQLRVEPSTPGLEVVSTLHQAITSRAAFTRTLSGGSLGSVIDDVDVPLTSLPTVTSTVRTLTLGLESPTGARDAARLGARRAGVYPLVVSLRDADDAVIDELVTYLVVVQPGPTGATPLDARLEVAWVWPLSAAPATLPSGTVDPGVVAALRPDGRLGRQAAALRRNADIPVTLVPGPETMKTWLAVGRDEPVVADGAAAVQDAARRTQVLDGAYVPIDLPSLLAAGLAGAADTQLAVGSATLDRVFDTDPDARTAVARPVDVGSLTRLRSGGVERVVVSGSALAASTDRTAVDRPFLLDTAAGFTPSAPVSAVAGDEELTSLLTGDAEPALRAQRLLAGLSLVALQDPDQSHAITLVNPDSFDPEPELLDAVFAGLRGNPWLAPASVATVFDTVAPATASNGTALTRQLAPYAPPRAPVSAPAYDDAQTRLNAFRSLVPPGDERVAAAEEALLSSVSSAWNSPGGALRANAELEAVDASIDSFLSQIHVPDPSTITLTSQSGEIPLTFRNDTGQTVSVLVELQSPKLFFPDGSSRLVDLPPKSTTVRFEVDARTSGSFPLHLSVRSADGALPITDSSFRVRSTAVSVVGLVLMIGAGAFLAVWWGWDIRRRRRARATA